MHQRATAAASGLRGELRVRPARQATVGRDATGDGLREVVHRHGVAHAAVVARDHFEILEADAVRRARSAVSAGTSSTGVLSACAGVEVDALGLEARDGFVEREIARVGGRPAHRAAAPPRPAPGRRPPSRAP